MRVTRIFGDVNGETHFGEIEIPLGEAGEIGRLSHKLPATGIIFRENDADYDYDWHTAPQRQYIILLDGEIEIEVSNDEKRRFCGGEILLLEDTTGKGHKTRVANDQPRRSIFVTIE